MTVNEKNTAMRAVNDIQQQIEAFEASWTKTYEKGDDTSEIDKMIDKLLSKRNGMTALLSELDVKYVRRDWIETRGLQDIPHTKFLLA